METLDDQLRRVLATRADALSPQLRGRDLRRLAAAQRGRTARISSQLAAAAAVLVVALLPYLLRDHSSAPVRPGAPGTVSSTPTPQLPASPRPATPPPSSADRPHVTSYPPPIVHGPTRQPTIAVRAASTSMPTADVPSILQGPPTGSTSATPRS